MTKRKRKVAIVIFYDRDLNILVQERGKHSKQGEKYGFWGGGIEEGETPEQAVKREILEELNYHLKEIKYWGPYSFVIDSPGSDDYGEVFYGEIFLSPITQELIDSKVEEGSGKAMVNIDLAIENPNREFGPTSIKKYMSKVKEDIIELINKSDS
jgi:8-oxo-dGTP pyrophosphatase MutT (NUDIX family)